MFPEQSFVASGPAFQITSAPPAAASCPQATPVFFVHVCASKSVCVCVCTHLQQKY